MNLAPNYSSNSLISSGDTATLVESASILSLDESDADSDNTTSAPFSRAATYQTPSAPGYHETVVDPARSRRHHGISGVAHRALSVFRRSNRTSKAAPLNVVTPFASTPSVISTTGTLLLNAATTSNLQASPSTGRISSTSAERITTDRLSLLLKNHDVLDYDDNPIHGSMFHQTCLKIISPLNFEGIRLLGDYRLPKLQGLHAYVHNPYSNHLDDLSTFIQQLPSVTYIWLYFCDEKSDDPEWAWELTVKLARFVSALSTKECRYLSISDHHFCSHNPITYESPSDVEKDQKVSSTAGPLQPKPFESLWMFTAGLRLLFTPPWLNWMVQTINASPLNTLHLTPSGALPWSTILPLIPVKSYQSFCMQGVTFSDLIRFLSRNPKVDVLSPIRVQFDLPSKGEGSSKGGPTKLSSPFPDGFVLPTLRTVIAEPDFIVHLLTNTNTSARPLLHSFMISGSSFPHNPSKHNPCDEMVSLYNAIQCIKIIRVPRAHFDFTVSSIQCLAWLLSQPFEQEKSSKNTSCITRIRLSFVHTSKHSPYQQLEILLPLWLSNFPSLDEFKFDYFSKDCTGERQLIKSIYHTCPSVEILSIGSIQVRSRKELA
ncbi:hypothetical protein JAAARDRAFT_41439 [Jaapia argillacea MUCL 33604]|uniref:Uncharacterized protein n=1 Tax=Jaapia argillacea MUCL 33604 TaxID=933084 RepID=A0A067PJG4_9AGAM|nr:hypothetical protein JAAARDRAFT_41439 [Jaapia argillacea MUCL 33604]